MVVRSFNVVSGHILLPTPRVVFSTLHHYASRKWVRVFSTRSVACFSLPYRYYRTMWLVLSGVFTWRTLPLAAYCRFTSCLGFFGSCFSTWLPSSLLTCLPFPSISLWLRLVWAIRLILASFSYFLAWRIRTRVRRLWFDMMPFVEVAVLNTFSARLLLTVVNRVWLLTKT